MEGVASLLLVLITITVLWIVGRQLAKIPARENSTGKPRSRGIEIQPFLYATGLKDYQANELRAIIDYGDELALSKFIAYYHPGFVELDQYLLRLRQRFSENLGKPLILASEIEKIAATNRTLFNDQPEPFDFTILTKSEFRLLLEFTSDQGRFINQEFMQQFGDTRFLEHFNEFKQLWHINSRTQYIPKNDAHRPLLDMLSANGTVLRGRKIDLQQRLSVLRLDQLNEMARELKLRQSFESLDKATQALSQIPGSAILLAMIYSIDDLFFINSELINVRAIERELNVYAAYAKLICWAAKQATPNTALSRSL